MIFVYSTAASEDEARKLAQLALEAKLAACVNMWPITAIYSWEGEVKNGEEVAMIFKTTEQCFQRLEMLITENHNYKTPCIAAIDVKRVNPAFREWLLGMVE